MIQTNDINKYNYVNSLENIVKQNLTFFLRKYSSRNGISNNYWLYIYKIDHKKNLIYYIFSI